MEHVDSHAQPQTSAGDAPVQLTPTAVEKAKAALSREGLAGWGLRVAVVGGGCSGFQYNLNFDKSAKDDDVEYDVDGLKIFVDAVSLQYVKGMVIDYVNGLHGAGFKFVNPNATRTCGCGSSFGVEP